LVKIIVSIFIEDIKYFVKNLKNNSTALINIIIDKNEKLKINKYL
jgi:hypothetical protein